MENIEMQMENVSLSSVKERILSIDDVYDFCQKQSKEFIFNNERTLLSKMQRIYS